MQIKSNVHKTYIYILNPKQLNGLLSAREQ